MLALRVHEDLLEACPSVFFHGGYRFPDRGGRTESRDEAVEIIPDSPQDETRRLLPPFRTASRIESVEEESNLPGWSAG